MENEIKTLSDIPAGQVYSIYPPKIEMMITGVQKCGIWPDGNAVLLYIDGSTEEAILTTNEATDIIAKGRESFFPVVSLVQSKARLAKTGGY